ncbi:heat shock 70 kDa protein 4 isoform X2 [Eupeodes corollae]|uniref:heat shock 70 kDa protein 4 isoform X2 n=1 Tax=Eupeodes corollae TaxID=290404 RepID=UPI0024922309|nr:heat shock 70 kDa protein 4 isoform X2 [Eupeodes corollae]
MSVIGIDFGNESCYVAAAKAGGIETLANDYSLRATPSCVAFDGKKRIIGVAAKNQQVTNMKNTVSGFKRLLGRKFNDPHVQRELTSIPYKVEQRPDGGIGIRVNYLDQDQLFSPEQLTAMLFTKLKETSTSALQAQVNDCVIACPIYYTNAERKALLDAASIAGLNVLRLMNETTATALSYGFYKQDLPEDKPRNVVFVDCGHSALQVSVCAFTKGKLKMLSSTWEQIGGRDFDYVLADHFAQEFQEKYKLNAKTNARAYLRLITEIEKMKKQMSANSTKLPLNIECFMNDVDVHSSMQRSTMEELCAHLFERVDLTLRRCLQESKLSSDEIHSVEIVGGSSRIPSIKALIEQTFGKPACTTLNQDESVSRGAALQCAIMSPAVRVREFGVTDIQNYAVKVIWEPEGSLTGGEIEVFPAFHAAPFSRMLTLNRKEPFNMTIQYAQPVPYPDSIIGKWLIKDVKPNEKGELQEVKVKVRINHHGIVLISSASLVDKKEIDESQSAGDEQQSGEQAAPTSATGEPMEVSQEGNDKKKRSNKLIELSMDIKTHGYSLADLTNYIQQESRMIANDAKETERVDARNALEEFVYDMRNKLQGGPLERFVAETDREAICKQLNDLEDWLYEDGEVCDRETYQSKLNNLHVQTDPIKERCQNYENAPHAFDELRKTIDYARSAIMEFRSGSPKYDHLTETEFINISEAAEKAEKWLQSALSKFTQTPRTSDSPVKVSEIRHESHSLSACLNSVVNRPKPKPPTPATKTTEQSHQNGESNQDKKEDAKTNSSIPEDSTMDVE